ncbi:MAG TPA: HAMP domain-containing sensor histidine kinase [Longimicrobiales bacterium]
MTERTTRQRPPGEPSAEAIKLRDNVLSIVAHDLRTPLSTIVMAAELLKQATTDARTDHFLGIILNAARQADALVKDLTDVTRIEARRLPLEFNDEPLAYLLSSVTELFEPIAESAGVLLGCNTHAVRGLDVRIDHGRFVQLLGNLISNAIKFTPPGGSVLIDAWRAGNFAKVVVRDTGIGISSDELPHVFQRFWQAQHHHRAGAGLGLAIAKGLVEVQGGEIGVTSAPQLGSTFFFTIPLSNIPP